MSAELQFIAHAAVIEIPLALVELTTFMLTRPTRNLPYGDGRHILFIPGFLTKDYPIVMMRKVFRENGYHVHCWKGGRNSCPWEEGMRRAERRLNDIYEKTGEPVTIIGHSLGGIIGRRLAHQQPDKIREVFTLGSPIHGSDINQGVKKLYQRVNPHSDVPVSEDFEEDFHDTVPTTILWSKSDFIGPESCFVPKEIPDTVRVVQVPGTHSGMPWNVMVARAIMNQMHNN